MSFLSVKEIFEREDLKTLIILTYELDEAALFDVCLVNNQNSKSIHTVKPVVFYDVRKTKEFFNAPPSVELVPYYKSGGKHHSKAYLFSTDSEVHLILGSLNLTKSGLLRNREVFKHFMCSKTDVNSVSLLQDFISFFEDNYQHRGTDNLKDSLVHIKSLIGSFETKKSSNHHLIHSGYGESGLRMLSNVWKNQFPDDSPDNTFIISPFFDAAENNIVKKLEKYGVKPASLHLVTARGQSEKLPISKPYYSEAIKHIDLKVYESDNKILPGTEESLEIKRFEQQQGRSVKADKEFYRELHAKIWIMSKGSRSLVYFGSGNFTINGWLGRNCELGICSWVESPIESLLPLLRAEYRFSDEEVSTNLFCDKLIVDDAGDEIERFKNFPAFIKSVELVGCENESVQFRFDLEPSEELKLTDYSIKWGDSVLSITDLKSQSFDLKTCLNLLLKRSLSFKHTSSSDEYFYPYLFDKEVMAKAKLVDFNSSSDYIESFIGGVIDDHETDIFHEKYGQPEIKELVSSSINRDDNLTIKLQRFISLLPALDRRLDDLLSEVRGSKALKEIHIKRYLKEPINDIVSFIESEFRSESSQAALIFRLSELLLIIKNKKAEELSSVETSLQNIINSYNKNPTSMIFKEYKQHVYG
jgi:hypothetical protein